MSRHHLCAKVIVLLLLATVAVSACTAAPVWTALDEYVWNHPNPDYSWKVVSRASVGSVDVAVLNMTSQTFLSKDTVDRPLWYHFLVVAVPKNIQTMAKRRRAFLYIGGSANRPDRPPSPDDPTNRAVIVAQNVGCVAAMLYQVPNQPLLFKNDTVLPGQPRVEDALIAWTWDKYMQSKGHEPFILARMPMVKAAVLAMDTVETFVLRETTGRVTINNWIVGGESKRGWTAWLVAATDFKRVDTVIPIVIDIVDTTNVLRRIRDSICGWPEAMKDYVVQGVTDRLETPEFAMMMQILDPLMYNERFEHMEKYPVNAGNDQFFWPDGSTFGYHRLMGPKSLRYVPNTGHSLDESDAIPATVAYIYARVHDIPLPRYSFNQTYTANGMQINAWLEPSSDMKGSSLTSSSLLIHPSSVRLWTITNSKARDFRLEVTGRTWTAKELPATNTEWSVTVPNPPSGFTAAMIEFTFTLPNKLLPVTDAPYLKFTTSAYITPNVTPC